MKKTKESKVEGQIRVMLQIRVVLQDLKGSVRDVTQDVEHNGYGLKDLQEGSVHASDCLNRVRELLQVLALAAENREHVDAALVKRVLDEVTLDLEDSSDLGHYVQYTQYLFEGAMALPYISGIRPEVFDVASKKEDRSLALAS